MQYSELYPNAKHNEEVEGRIVYLDSVTPCAVCSESTHFVDLDFETGICSEECSWVLWEEWVEANMIADRKQEMKSEGTGINDF